MNSKITLLIISSMLATMPNVYALNLSYGECVILNSTMVCAPIMNNATTIITNVSYANCISLFYDNATELSRNSSQSCADVKRMVFDLSNQFMNTYENLTPNFVKDTVECRIANREMSEEIDTLSVQANDYTECNNQLVQYRNNYNELYQNNQTLMGQLILSNNNLNTYAFAGFIAGAGLIYVFYRKKSREGIEKKDTVVHSKTIIPVTDNLDKTRQS